jgi:hypothetical protein
MSKWHHLDLDATDALRDLVEQQAHYRGNHEANQALNRADEYQGKDGPNQMSMGKCLQSDKESNDFAKDEVDSAHYLRRR